VHDVEMKVYSNFKYLVWLVVKSAPIALPPRPNLGRTNPTNAQFLRKNIEEGRSNNMKRRGSARCQKNARGRIFCSHGNFDSRSASLVPTVGRDLLPFIDPKNRNNLKGALGTGNCNHRAKNMQRVETFFFPSRVRSSIFFQGMIHQTRPNQSHLGCGRPQARKGMETKKKTYGGQQTICIRPNSTDTAGRLPLQKAILVFGHSTNIATLAPNQRGDFQGTSSHVLSWDATYWFAPP